MRTVGILLLSLASCVSNAAGVSVERDRASVAPRIVGSWNMATWNGTRMDGVSLRFSPDGRLSGTVQCNTVAGTYVLNGATLDWRSVDVTTLGCSGAAARAAGPAADRLLAAGSLTVSVRSGRLALRSSTDAWIFRKRFGPMSGR